MTNHRFIEACYRRPVARTPVWMMRQAGRYLPEYRALRTEHDFITMYKTPELAAEVTVQPIRRFNMDAAILFSDILVIPEAMGMELVFEKGRGPVFPTPLRSRGQIDGLKHVDPATALPFVTDAIKLVKGQLEGKTPLIGFSGAPWTLVTYMIEGSGSKQFSRVREWRYAQPDLLAQLISRVADAVIDYVEAQIEAGVDAIQLFDTWAGLLDYDGYKQFALEPVQRIIDTVKKSGVPIIYFAKNTMNWLEDVASSGADVIGLDWGIPLGQARERIGNAVALQGNLDPATLYAPPTVIRRQVQKMLSSYGSGSGHIANLGHGILPDIPVPNAGEFIAAVQEESIKFHDTENINA